MELYTGVVYPAVLVVSAVLAITGLVTLAWPPARRALRVLTPLTYAVVGVHATAVVILLVTVVQASLVLTLGYLIASAALMVLLGIGRLGTPEAAANDPDPNRPVLSPVQIARVDGASALIVAIALATVAWRIHLILEAAA